MFRLCCSSDLCLRYTKQLSITTYRWTLPPKTAASVRGNRRHPAVRNTATGRRINKECLLCLKTVCWQEEMKKKTLPLKYYTAVILAIQVKKNKNEREVEYSEQRNHFKDQHQWRLGTKAWIKRCVFLTSGSSISWCRTSASPCHETWEAVNTPTVTEWALNMVSVQNKFKNLSNKLETLLWNKLPPPVWTETEHVLCEIKLNQQVWDQL